MGSFLRNHVAVHIVTLLTQSHIGIEIGIYLGCFLPGGNSAHNYINSTNQQAYIKRKHTQKKRRDGMGWDGMTSPTSHVLFGIVPLRALSLLENATLGHDPSLHV